MSVYYVLSVYTCKAGLISLFTRLNVLADAAFHKHMIFSGLYFTDFGTFPALRVNSGDSRMRRAAREKRSFFRVGFHALRRRRSPEVMAQQGKVWFEQWRKQRISILSASVIAAGPF